jgi:hypothetical protein
MARKRPVDATSINLYFGRDIRKKGRVSDDNWQKFQVKVIARALRGKGVYVYPDGSQVSEDSFFLEIVSTNRTVALAAAEVIADEYKRRFKQASVLIVWQNVKMIFR